MFFKPQSLIRPGLWKSATQGYAQSLIAGYQSSSATQNTQLHNFNNNNNNNNVTNHFHKSSPYHPHNVQSSNNPSAGAGAKPGQVEPSSGDRGLDAYYAAWQKHQRREGEWHQFQFAKRLGWKAPTTIPDTPAKGKDGQAAALLEDAPARAAPVRTQSAGAIDDIKRSNQKSTAKGEVSRLDGDAIAKEIGIVTGQTLTGTSESQQQDGVAQWVATAHNSASSASPSSFEQSSRSHLTDATSSSDGLPYLESLSKLAEGQRYGEIPAVFEAMLHAGVKPTASAYNALLLAAINLPREKHQIVSKVLDVYSDMLRRRVLPETSTYSIMLELLATRALDVRNVKKHIEIKQLRYRGANEGQYPFRSDETESKILAEDDSLSIAVKLFDTSAAVAATHIYSPETYQLLICACAEAGRIGDMVRIYADMESQGLRPSSNIFAPMICAFASAGDLRSAVECYDEYKALAVSNDDGKFAMLRQDDAVYAAVVKAYAMCGRLNGGLKFLSKVEETLEGSESLALTRDTIGLQALNQQWLQENRHMEALEHANTMLTPKARQEAVSAICIDAADKDMATPAVEAYGAIYDEHVSTIKPAMAILAMHIRAADLSAANRMWKTFELTQPSAEFIEPTTMYAMFLIENGSVELALQHCRQSFSRVRSVQDISQKASIDVIERIDEALDVIGQSVLGQTVGPSISMTMELMWMMNENGGLIAVLAERLLASVGPGDVSRLALDDMNLLVQVQAGIITTHNTHDVAHVARFSHLLDMIVSSTMPADQRTSKMIEQALTKLDRPDVTMRWQKRQYSLPRQMLSSTQYPAVFQQPPPMTSAYEDMYDPYASSTDFKASTAIAEELQKTYGRHSSHLNEALTKFKNIRRAGRHPRYVTYAKLIVAAAKEDRISLAHEILAMAKQDVPFVENSRVVRHGWISILDSMVGACLAAGKRDLAAQHHQELTAIGAAPSANTFGLYITTMKESTKTFDEATEAVKIFHRAKSEGVEPSSFLYNALIGKLGKARRIDDCLFYFAEMRGFGIRPTSVTYGTIVNALCRVSDDKFAEELFEEMEGMPNYKPRPAPYNSLMQYFLTTKRDRSKVLAYYQRMKANKIQPTMHTFKLLIDTHATLEPVDMAAAEAVFDDIRTSGAQPEAVHYAALIHAKGCVLHDLSGARKVFEQVIAEGRIPPQASLYQAMFEAMVASHEIAATQPLLEKMAQHRVAMTPYIANTLIHGWAIAKDVGRARAIFDSLGREKREPSTYEAMTRAYLAAEDHGRAIGIVGEALRRGYPAAVANKICELVGSGGALRATVPPVA